MPLRPIEFEILVALADEDRHGYGIMQAVEAFTAGARTLEAGTLYRALHRMLECGWIAECGPPRALRGAGAPGVDDVRRKYYRLTPLGRRIASEEAEQLSRLVSAARAHKLLRRA